MKCDPVHQGHLCLMSRILGRRTTLWSSCFTSSGTEPPPAEWAGVTVTGAPVLLTCQCWSEALSRSGSWAEKEISQSLNLLFSWNRVSETLSCWDGDRLVACPSGGDTTVPNGNLRTEKAQCPVHILS